MRALVLLWALALAGCGHKASKPTESAKGSNAAASAEPASPPPAGPPFTITVNAHNAIAGEAFGTPAIAAFSSSPLKNHREGQERSDCQPTYGQTSASGVAAGVTVVRQEPDSVQLQLETAAEARGGHYRRCGACAGTGCVGREGNDTVGTARGRAAARIAIRFAQDLLYNDYEIRVGTSGRREALTVRLSDEDGREIRRQPNEPYAVRAEPGSLVFLDTALEAASESRGGAPQKLRKETATVDVRISKAPILALTRGASPFIVGGEPTSAFPEVVAILLRGQIHCSGTVIAPRTVLTAAHCIQGYEADIARKEMTVQGGTTITQPEWGPVTVVAGVFPDGKDGSIRFNPDRHMLTHDIGLLYVGVGLPVAPAPLHLGQPPWTAIKPVPIYFVGFGYDKLGSKQHGAGVKREAAWTVSNVDDLRLYFRGTKASTCHADSGGPAFFIKSGATPTKLLVGITSGGDDDCTQGFDTRVDAYRNWLTTRVRS